MSKELTISSYGTDASTITELFKGNEITSCEQIEEDEILIKFINGEYLRMYHSQDCCESVFIEDINGSLDLEGAIFYEIIEKSNFEKEPLEDYDESYTWTFYTIRTSKGYLDIRWYGSSNGYYSEGVDTEIGYYKGETNEKDS